MAPDNPQGVGKDATGLWPYVTEREYGKLEQEVAEVRHDFRNLRTIANDTSDLAYELRSELHQFKTRVYTVAFVVGIVASIFGWLVENVVFR